MERTVSMLTCRKCQFKFSKEAMVEGPKRMIYCKNCYKNLYCAGDAKSESSFDLNNKLMPYPEIYSYHRRADWTIKNGSSSTASLSKRPLQCPNPECNKFISLFNLESHFKYEHKEVPVIFTRLDARSSLEYCPSEVRFNITQCIVLLNVINHNFSNVFPRTRVVNLARYVSKRTKVHIPDSRYNKVNQQATNTKPVMVLLSTRIAQNDLNEFEYEGTYTLDYNYEKADEDSASTLTNAENYSLLRTPDKLIIWLASNIYTNLSYTIAASTLTNEIRQKYFGPMLTLGDNPIDLCRTGTCLILNHFHVNGMTDNGTKPLALDVLIHSPD